jgi:aminoglycoside phosphotransferase family enzyme
MHKLDRRKQMDNLLSQGNVTADDMGNLARKIAYFHKSADVIYTKNVLQIRNEFNDLGAEKEFIEESSGKGNGDIISLATGISDSFIVENKELLNHRLREGFFRDCHGDLHSRNIFLLPEPQPFDCIERFPAN